MVCQFLVSQVFCCPSFSFFFDIISVKSNHDKLKINYHKFQIFPTHTPDKAQRYDNSFLSLFHL